MKLQLVPDEADTGYILGNNIMVREVKIVLLGYVSRAARMLPAKGFSDYGKIEYKKRSAR